MPQTWQTRRWVLVCLLTRGGPQAVRHRPRRTSLPTPGRAQRLGSSPGSWAPRRRRLLGSRRVPRRPYSRRRRRPQSPRGRRGLPELRRLRPRTRGPSRGLLAARGLLAVSKGWPRRRRRPGWPSQPRRSRPAGRGLQRRRRSRAWAVLPRRRQGTERPRVRSRRPRLRERAGPLPLQRSSARRRGLRLAKSERPRLRPGEPARRRAAPRRVGRLVWTRRRAMRRSPE